MPLIEQIFEKVADESNLYHEIYTQEFIIVDKNEKLTGGLNTRNSSLEIEDEKKENEKNILNLCTSCLTTCIAFCIYGQKEKDGTPIHALYHHLTDYTVSPRNIFIQLRNLMIKHFNAAEDSFELIIIGAEKGEDYTKEEDKKVWKKIRKFYIGEATKSKEEYQTTLIFGVAPIAARACEGEKEDTFGESSVYMTQKTIRCYIKPTALDPKPLLPTPLVAMPSASLTTTTTVSPYTSEQQFWSSSSTKEQRLMHDPHTATVPPRP